MAASFFIDVTRRCVFSRVWDALVDDDLYGHTFAIREHPLFDRAFTQVMDFRDATEVLVSTECVRQLAEHNPWAPEARRAFLMTSALQVGLARVYHRSGNSPADGVEIFERREAALAWVGLHPTTEWPREEPHWSTSVRV